MGAGYSMTDILLTSDLKTTNWDKYFPHFRPEEYFSPGGLYLFHTKNVIPCDTAIVYSLELLRTELNLSRGRGDLQSDDEIYISVNTKSQELRGFVTPEEWLHKRSKRKNQVYSFHLWCAADISSNVSPDILFEHAVSTQFRGIIQYSWGLHLDRREGETYIRKQDFKAE